MEPEAAVAILHAAAAPESVLLIRRAASAADPWSGHWSFPGGKRAPADSDLIETALRELREECAIALDRASLRQALDHRAARRAAGDPVLVAPFVFQLPAALPTILNPREAVESIWLPLDTWRDRSQHGVRPVPGRPEQMRYPSIEVNGVPVWGFTYALINQWLRLEPG